MMDAMYDEEKKKGLRELISQMYEMIGEEETEEESMEGMESMEDPMEEDSMEDPMMMDEDEDSMDMEEEEEEEDDLKSEIRDYMKGTDRKQEPYKGTISVVGMSASKKPKKGKKYRK